MKPPLQYPRFRPHFVHVLFAISQLIGCKGQLVGAPLASSGGVPSGATSVSGTGGQADGGTGGQADGGTDLDSCKTNSECVIKHGNVPCICKNNRCLVLTDDTYCPLVIPANALTFLKSTATEYSPIIVGGFAYMNNPQNLYETTSVVNWALAMDEFNKSSTLMGLAGFNGGNRRPLLGLMCYSTITDVGPIMKRLTGEVGVSAILTARPADLLSAYNYTTTSGNPTYQGGPVIFMNASSANSVIASTDTQHLVWNMLGDPNVVATDVAALLKQIEPYVNKQRAANGDVPDPNKNPLKVTLVTSDYPGASELGQTLQSANRTHPESQLWFNNKLAIDQGINSTGNYRMISEPSNLGLPNNVAVNTSGVLTEIQNYPPHVIVVMATNEFAKQVISKIESSWSATWGLTQIRPYYIMSPYLVNSQDLLDAVSAASGESPPLSTRVMGANYASAQDETSKALYNSYQLRLANFYQSKLILSGTENFYDAAYYLLYSIAQASASSSNPDGNAISTALMNRIISDSPTDPGYVYVDPYGNPSLGQTIGRFTDPHYAISLWGTMGAPNFDKATGMRISPTSAWCIGLQSGSTPAYEYKYDGLFYDPKNRNFTPNTAGVPACLGNYCPLPAAGTEPCPLSY